MRSLREKGGGGLAQSQNATIKQGTFLTFMSDNMVYVYTQNTEKVKLFLKLRLYKGAFFCPIIYSVFKIIKFLNP